MYTENLLDHFTNPRNTGVISGADGVGTIGDPECGDFIRIYISVLGYRLRDVSFEVCGCPAAIATTSIMTELVKGKTLVEALAVNEMDIVRAIGGLPDPKIHCSNLGLAALKQAIIDYLEKEKSRANLNLQGEPLNERS